MSNSLPTTSAISNLHNSTVLLTGATGYIGSVVAERLIANGYRVRGLVRSKKSAQKAALRGIEPWIGDLTDTAAVAKAINGVDGVIHTATLGGEIPGMSFEEAVAQAVSILDNLRSLTAEAGIRLISTSGTSMYGDTEAQIAHESSPTQVPPFLQPLADIENKLIEAPHVHILRTSMVYGRAGGSGILAAIQGVQSRGRAALVKDDSEISFIHVDDLADLYLHLLQTPDAPRLVIAVSQITGVKDFMAAVTAAIGVEKSFDKISPQEALSSFGAIGMYMTRNMRVSASLAQEIFGWKPSRKSLIEELQTGSYRYASSH